METDRTFGLTKRGNSEVLFAWLRIAIRNRYQPAMPALERFLTTQGRRKFLSRRRLHCHSLPLVQKLFVGSGTPPGC